MNDYNTTNENLTFNIIDLQKKHYNREQKRTKLFNKILSKCYRKIKQAFNNEYTYCIFQVPEFELGEPIFNMTKCVIYILQNLRKNGFYCKYCHPFLIFISWQQTNNNLALEYQQAGLSLLNNKSTYNSTKKNNEPTICPNNQQFNDISPVNKLSKQSKTTNFNECNNKPNSIDNSINKSSNAYKEHSVDATPSINPIQINNELPIINNITKCSKPEEKTKPKKNTTHKFGTQYNHKIIKEDDIFDPKYGAFNHLLCRTKPFNDDA